ncbi:MAG: alpha/beta hydrolase, partial [Bacteroidales bacterium]|nr:alpha/beta hydrolase [Bacteroidales bacterium]
VVDSSEDGFTVLLSKKKTARFVKELKYLEIPKNRYLEEIFDEVEMQEYVYAKAPGYYSSKPCESSSSDQYAKIIADLLKEVNDNFYREAINLELDLYQPKNDKFKNRPLIVLVHQGAFIVGDKRDAFNVSLAEHYAKCGFVVASINYRMGFVPIPFVHSNFERAMYRAAQDARAALRFLSAKHKEFGINPDYFFIGGNSAGGFISLFAAYMEDYQRFRSSGKNSILFQDDLGCMDCVGNEHKANFTLKGVINMWGAVADLDIFDEHENIPTLLIHGDLDKIVSCDYDLPFTNVGKYLPSIFTKKLYGSRPIYEKLKSMNKNVDFYLIENATHEPYEDDDYVFTELYDSIEYRIKHFMIDQFKTEKLKLVALKNSKSKRSAYRAIAKDEVVWHVKGGVVIDKKLNDIEIVWLNNQADKQIHAYELNDLAYVSARKVKIK